VSPFLASVLRWPEAALDTIGCPRETGGVRVAFEDFELDTDRVELLHCGEPVAMEPRVFDVLVHLVSHRDRVVAKSELLDGVWGDRFVSESALSSCIRHVRRALGDDGGSQRYLKTAHGRGYRFVAAVTVLDQQPTDGSARPASAALHNLPADRTPLLGRDEAIESIGALLGPHRLVTLTGMGGAGKTRLAVAVGRSLVDRFAEGVWFVDLVPTDDASSVVGAIAHSCGIALSPGDATSQIAAVLARREALIILDNAEHVRESLAATVDAIVEHTKAPCFLVTSREPLGLQDERLVRVTPLTIGDDGRGPATELLRTSAERFGVDVRSVADDTAQRICEQLDGLPLAIELAAAQLRVLTPGELAERLDDRFEILRSPLRSDDHRHASLASVLDDTWSLLDGEERALLGRLGAFAGPFAVTDVEEISHDPGQGHALLTLGRLVDRALVVEAPGPQPRFRLLETVRVFTGQRADPLDAADAHAAWCLRRVGANAGDYFFDAALAAWCADHFDDLRTAEQHLIRSSRPLEAARLTTATALAMHCDAGARAAAVLVRIDEHLGRIDDPLMRALLHCTGAMAAMSARAPETLASHGVSAVHDARRNGDPGVLAVALVFESWSTVLSDPARALEIVDEASALAASVGDARARDHADSYRAFHLAMHRRYDEALDQAARVIDRTPDLDVGDYPAFVAMVAWSACNVLAEPAVAQRFVDTLLRRPSPTAPMWGNEVLAAAIHASAGDPAVAVKLTLTVHDRLRRAGREPLPDLLLPAAVLAHRRSDDARAGRWLRAIRDAGLPTQSFQVTCAYRRVRDVVGVADEDRLASSTLAEIGDEAIGWMTAALAT
jgi:predicted ATPase/DNA-binding winged helix-turn-helix (wHTH) protein